MLGLGTADLLELAPPGRFDQVRLGLVGVVVVRVGTCHFSPPHLIYAPDQSTEQTHPSEERSFTCAVCT